MQLVQGPRFENHSPVEFRLIVLYQHLVQQAINTLNRAGDLKKCYSCPHGSQQWLHAKIICHGLGGGILKSLEPQVN